MFCTNAGNIILLLESLSKYTHSVVSEYLLVFVQKSLCITSIIEHGVNNLSWERKHQIYFTIVRYLLGHLQYLTYKSNIILIR